MSTKITDRPVRFINNLTHTGDFSGEPFKLRGWQRDVILKLLGTLREDGTRQYRKGFLALPRKQGKTELAASIILYLLLGTGKTGQRIYSASGTRDQASLVFGAASTMIANDPTLSKYCRIYKAYRKIECPELDSTYEALSSDAPTKHGLGPSAVIFDEVHVLPDRELHDVLTTGFAARREPLTLYITTAGWDRHSLCWELWKYAENVRDGLVDDPRFLPVLYQADPEDDWRDENVWRKAMPALGDFCSLEFIREECKRAENFPSYENTFRQLYLNQWTEQAVRWLSLASWDNLSHPLDIGDYAGRECYAALDLAAIYDLSALALLFPRQGEGIDLLFRFWAPKEGVRDRERNDNVPYTAWNRAGDISLTDGETVDYDRILDDIMDISKLVKIKAFGADPWNFEAMGQKLMSNRLNVLKIPQSFASLSAPSKEFERMIVDGKLRHDGNQVMRWCVQNVAIDRDNNENIRPSKKKSNERIDGVMAAVMSVALNMTQPKPKASIYESRGVFSL